MDKGERFNSITHLFGTILALMGLGALLTVAMQTQNLPLLISFLIFGVSLVLLYSMSTLYHISPTSPLKTRFQKLDHASIYILIAGTYTPLMVVSLAGKDGMLMLTLIWGMAAVGLVLDLLVKKRIKWLQVLIYLTMGWACILNHTALSEALTASGTAWLGAGGVAYTFGVIFYVLDKMNKLPHAHGIWHLFVLAGSICHFITIILFVR